MISGIILASGLSRRMGEDKLLLPVEGVPVIERVIAAASKSELGEIILVCASDSVADKGKKYRTKIVKNNAPEIGQSHSVSLGVKNSCRSADGFMFLVGDQPFINESIINKLIEEFLPGRCSAVVPLYNGIKGNPVIFASKLRNKLMSLSGDSGGRVLLEKMEEGIITVNFADGKPGLDIDTREEYEAITRLEGKNG
jgi:molybdenum cofactor cytidylyltransferase